MNRRNLIKTIGGSTILALTGSALAPPEVDWKKYGIIKKGTFLPDGTPEGWIFDLEIAAKNYPNAKYILDISQDWNGEEKTVEVLLCGGRSEILSDELFSVSSLSAEFLRNNNQYLNYEKGKYPAWTVSVAYNRPNFSLL